MKYNFITIEREYGSGGTRIAEIAAESLNIPCYGREILEEVSKELNLPQYKIEKSEESATNSFLYSVLMLGQLQTGRTDITTDEGRIYAAEQKIIRNFAAKGPAVFLGHCASEALKNRSGVVKVFIRADSGDKKARVIEDYGIPPEAAEETMRRFDKKRANYYYANTMKKWDSMSNYDIILNSSGLGINGCAEVLSALASAGRGNA